MNEGRNANKPQRRWSRASPPNHRNSPRPVGSRGHDHTSANAQKSYDSYLALAREAASRGDTIAAENFYQHAEHFLRVLKGSTL
jgi:Domain of unknown function (DUF4167)